MDTTENAQALPETVHRSPHTFEIVEPTSGDQRRTPENIAKRVAGHQAHSTGNGEQLLVNSELVDHPVTNAEATDPDRLFNASASNPPNFAILSEKPEHRIVVYLKAQGLSNKEIATKTGYTPAWICQITRQPWFRLRLVQELKEAGIDAVQTVLKSSVLDSVFTLVDIRDDVTTPKAVRRACADSILDRYFGKPVQKLETEEKRLPSSSEISSIDKEVADIDHELQTTKTQETN